MIAVRLPCRLRDGSKNLVGKLVGAKPSKYARPSVGYLSDLVDCYLATQPSRDPLRRTCGGSRVRPWPGGLKGTIAPRLSKLQDPIYR